MIRYGLLPASGTRTGMPGKKELFDNDRRLERQGRQGLDMAGLFCRDHVNRDAELLLEEGLRHGTQLLIAASSPPFVRCTQYPCWGFMVLKSE